MIKNQEQNLMQKCKTCIAQDVLVPTMNLVVSLCNLKKTVEEVLPKDILQQLKDGKERIDELEKENQLFRSLINIKEPTEVQK